ncbi:unnamed protein product, partial [Phaeothamnion confervicola]
SDWWKVLRGCTTWAFWRGTASPYEPAFAWYLDMVRKTVDVARKETGAPRVILVGHSAGGWLARAAMGAGTWDETAGTSTEDVVAGLVSLGTPHFPGPADMTRGALSYTSATFPGAFLADRGIFYVTVAGSAVEGVEAAPQGDIRRFSFVSYQTVCGQGDVGGDTCVPVCSAHLEGAEQITLPGVYHSINEPDRWYGAETVVDLWLPAV